MEQRQYHCFVAGLPEMSFDDLSPWTGPAKFIKQMRRELHPDDMKLADLMLLRFDNTNLVRFLQGKELLNKGIALFSADDFRRQLEIFEAIVPEPDILPPYMSGTLRFYSSPDEPFHTVESRRMLDNGYYQWALDNGNRFVREYTAFEYNLSNMLTYIINGRKGLKQPDEGLSGDSDFTGHLHETAGKTLVKDPEFEYFDDILTIVNSFTMTEAEIHMDRLRWNVIDKLTLFSHFTADVILANMQKLLIVSRWASMSDQSGREKLEETIDKALGPVPLLND